MVTNCLYGISPIIALFSPIVKEKVAHFRATGAQFPARGLRAGGRSFLRHRNKGGMVMLTFEFTGAEGKMTVSQVLTSGMVGRRVRFLFSPEWENLRKTAVFTAGEVTRDVTEVREEAVIPARVLEKPLEQLYVGIYGTNAQGDLVIPTVWVPGPVIKPGADPSGDPSTAPDLPVWDRILTLMGSLEDLDTDARETLVAAINENAQARRELQADWSQGDANRYDHIKNRTHWMSDNRVTLSWNGNRNGKPVIYLPKQNRWYCRVGDQTPGTMELVGGTVRFSSGDTQTQEQIRANDMTLGDYAFLAASGAVLVVRNRAFSLGEDQILAPKTGIYLWFDQYVPNSYASAITWGKLNILRLDDRYIPTTVARRNEVGFLQGSQAAELLMQLLQNVTYSGNQTANLEALAQALGVSGTGQEPAGIYLTELTVTYTGGEVPAGTSLTDLVGLSVLASFSDGSQEYVHSYTLSGDIQEGLNEITVIYQGKTATFQVMGTGSSQSAPAPVGYSVDLVLTGCTADRGNSYASGGLPLAVRLTAEAGYTLTGARVTVTMNGEDITATAYSQGMVTIGTVTGPVEIIVAAVAL